MFKKLYRKLFYSTDAKNLELDGGRLLNECELFLRCIYKDESFKKKLNNLRKIKELKKTKSRIKKCRK